ncbi:hypothetical protein CCMA1212_006981 [Trichoderma ghanense]|uniref:Heterokaryon incompatibility domain-containing protein n=1 Tax=Trichoderma ghanense TaxID=65468 RepID=A0ABY2GYY2_9HYPO
MRLQLVYILSAIRLVMLLPAVEAHADIVCRLCNSTLSRSDIDRYQALSYNLEAALRNLRHRNRPRVPWIDAICINQNDVMERNARMDLIYERSERVIVWLGPESEDSSNPTITDTPYCTRYVDMSASSLASVGQLCSRPWFARIWCIQEFILGPHAVFQCGQYEMSWEDILAFSKLFEDLLSNASMIVDIPTVDGLNTDLKIGQHHDKTVLALLRGFKGWQSSDPRDFIFALYGLVPDGDRDKDILRPNHEPSVSELYTRVAMHFLHRYRDLTILSIATQPAKEVVTQDSWLPCWVPDWRQSQLFGVDFYYSPIAYNGRGSVIISLDANFDASLGLKATPISLEDDEQVLCLNGITADTIEAVGDVHLGVQQSIGGPRAVIPARASLCGRPFAEPLFSTAEWKLSKVGPCPGAGVPLEEFEPGRFGEYMDGPSAVEDVKFLANLTLRPGAIVRRRFFRTSRGMFGLGPDTAGEGDSVVVLFGGRVPFIIRDLEWHHLIAIFTESWMAKSSTSRERKHFNISQEETFRLG